MGEKLMLPLVFIGSSSEALAYAEAVQKCLHGEIYGEVWNLAFPLGYSTLETLYQKKTDFAMFIFSPDDKINIRGKEGLVARDNVIFETGLFMGKLGLRRVFFAVPVYPKDHPLKKKKFRIPSDLEGITYGTYDASHPDKAQAVNIFCKQALAIIKEVFFQGNGNEDPFILPNNELDVEGVDKEITHEVTILNTNGDAIVKTIQKHMTGNKQISYRKHECLCFSGLEGESISAFDKKNNKLHIEYEVNMENRKVFKVCFKEPITPKTEVVYSCQYMWRGLFPAKEEFFMTRYSAEKMHFHLILPNEITLATINTYERDSNGNSVEKGIERTHNKKGMSINSNNYTLNRYTLPKMEKGREVEIRWRIF